MIRHEGSSLIKSSNTCIFKLNSALRVTKGSPFQNIPALYYFYKARMLAILYFLARLLFILRVCRLIYRELCSTESIRLIHSFQIVNTV